MATEKKARNEETVERFTLAQRIEHWVLVVAFTGLAITGLPQKFALQPWAETMIGIMGGIEAVRVIHRVLATLLMLEVIYHGGVTTYRLFVLRLPPYMLPAFSDFVHLFQQITFNLGLRQERPRMDRFNYEEKLEYWAVVWGTMVMVITGFMLWNPIATTRFLPGQFIPAAKTAHGGEALLAVLSIITWHVYSVHVRHFNPSMFSGKISRHAMEEEHALELARIEAGRVPQPPAAAVYRKRMRAFIPFALFMTALLVAALVWFVTFEETAITTIPPVEVEVVPPELQQ